MAKLDPNYKLIREIAELKEQLTTANEKILDYEQTEAAVCPEDVGIAEFVKSLNEKAERVEKFARHIICQYCWDVPDSDKLEPDGGDIQRWAEKLGLIEPYIVTADEADNLFEEGDDKYRFTKMLKG